MSEQIKFLNMFSDYAPPEDLQKAFSQAAVVAADVDPATRTVSVAVYSAQYIPFVLLQQAQRDIMELYGLARVEIVATHPADQLHKLEISELAALFVAEDSMNMGSLAGADWQWQENTMHIQLRANGKDSLIKAVPAVSRQLRERFGCDVDFEIQAGQALEGQALYDAMEQMRAEFMQDLPKVAAVEKKEQKPADSPTFYGKPFKGVVTPMHELNLDMGSVIVEGRVFSVEHKELKKRNAWVVNFDMTDNTGSVRINRFMESSEAKPILENVKEGSVLKVQGRLQINQFDNEMVLKPFSMMPGEMPKRRDLAEGEKRVELHLHTIMSNMDALTNTKDAIKQAAAWGHKAIAITDHGCCQSFTDALHVVDNPKFAPKVAGTDDPIKILYGCEGYYVNDVDDRIVVHGTKDISFDGQYVAFDLETTGLSSKHDRIIEIGAVLMENGQESDRFQTFVDPEMRLQKDTIDLTGITDNMLKGAPKLEEVFPKFLEFVGDRVLVAHNADFDTGFIRAACEKLGYTYSFTSADTLVMAQNLLPHLSKFKLDVVANALNLPEFNHHRAADDAVTCGLIAAKLFEKMEEMDIHTLQTVNPAMEGLRSQGNVGNRHARHIILFAKNQMGLRNLYHLISLSNLEYFKRQPRMPKSEILKYREGLIIGSACEAGELFQAMMDGKSEDELKRIASFYDFLEIQPLSNNAFMLEKGIVKEEEELRQFNRTIVRLGEELGKPVVATGDVHFLHPEDEIFRHILLATKGFDDCDRPNPLYFRTTDEMLKEFSYLGEEKAYEVVVTNPNLIADMCDSVRPVPHNLFAPKIENSVEDLKDLVYGKMHRLYGENPPELIRKRIDTELNDIITCHYDVIYMSAQRLVQNSLVCVVYSRSAT